MSRIKYKLQVLRIRIQCLHETELLDDSLALPGFPTLPCKIGSSEEEFVHSDDVANSHLHIQPAVGQNPSLVDSKLVMVFGGSLRQELRRQHVPHNGFIKWIHLSLFCCSQDL
uniref:Uncharacterized protein n=1 Tax=Vitis vinifera TaxID=29760 RepID=F6GU57_VITVI